MLIFNFNPEDPVKETRVIDLQEDVKTIELADEEKVIMLGCPQEVPICENCHYASPSNKKRLCTENKVLCKKCRRKPELRIIVSYELKRRLPNLPQKNWPMPVGKMTNVHSCRYRPHNVYRCIDVLLICSKLNIPIPDYFLTYQ